MNPSLRRRKFAGCLHGTCCPSREWEVVLLLLHFRSIECKDQSKLCLCRNHGSGAHVLAYEPQQTNMTHLSSLKERQGLDTHATERTECPLVTVLPRQRDKALLARKALRRSRGGSTQWRSMQLSPGFRATLQLLLWIPLLRPFPWFPPCVSLLKVYHHSKSLLYYPFLFQTLSLLIPNLSAPVFLSRSIFKVCIVALRVLSIPWTSQKNHISKTLLPKSCVQNLC